MHRVSISNIVGIIIAGVLFLGILLGFQIGFKGFNLLLAVALLAIFFLAITIIKPWIAICAFLLFIPLENLYVFQTGFVSTITKLLGAYLVFLLIINGSLNNINEVFKNTKVLWILLYGGVAALSIFVSKNASQSIGFLFSLWLSIIMYFVMIMMVREYKTLQIATLALIVGAALSVLSPMILGYGIVSGYIWERYGGLWGDQNEFAAILVGLMPLSIFLFFSYKQRLLKIISAICAVILFMGLIFTYSRGGYLAFIVLTILTMFKFIGGKNRVRILAVAVPTIIIGSVVLYSTAGEQILSRMETLSILQSSESVRKEASLNLRYYYYFKLSPKVFIEHPILGVGMRQFINYNPFRQVTHNTFLEVLTGTGLLGFVPFAMMLFLTWKELRIVDNISSRFESGASLSLYSQALTLGFIAYIVAGMFISLDINKMLWIFITLSSVLLNINRIDISNRFTHKTFRQRLPD